MIINILIINLGRQSVERRVRHDHELLGREELDDEEEGRHLRRENGVALKKEKMDICLSGTSMKDVLTEGKGDEPKMTWVREIM